MSDSMADLPKGADRDPIRRPSRLRRLVKAILLLALTVVAVSAAVFLYFYTSSPSVHDVVDSIVTRSSTPEEAFPGRDVVNVLLLGRDVDRDRRGRVVNSRGRTDVMVLAHVDFRNRQVSLLSIPRDTLAHIPGYRGRRRISYANALGGPELAGQAMHELISVLPDHYVLVNFDGFEKTIDAVGGLEITVDKQLDYDDDWGNLHIHLKPGRQILNGGQAMGFVRYRQSNGGEGESDFVRISRQQELLRAAKARLAGAGTMFKVPRVLDMIRADTKSSLTTPQMLCLASFVKSLPSSSIRMETLPALSANTIFVRADPDATEKLVREMFFGN